MLNDGYHDVGRGMVAAVVTDLEMTARPAPRPVPDIPGLTLTLEDPPTRDWYLSLYKRIGMDWLWYGRLELARETLDALLSDPRHQIYALRRDGDAVGLMELDFRSPGECELAYFGLTPDMVGTGAGRWLMDKAIDHAFAEPITRFHVSTCTNDSPQALDFYIRSGFTPYRRRVEAAQDPRLLGHYPRTAAPHIPIIE